MSNQPPARPLFRFGSLARPAPAPTRAPASRTQTQPTPSPPLQTRPASLPLFIQTFGPFATQPAHEAPRGPQAPNTTTPSAPTHAVSTAPSMPSIAAAPPLRPRAAVPAPPPPHDVVSQQMYYSNTELETDGMRIINIAGDGMRIINIAGDGMRIINIAGENKGALMVRGYSTKKQVGGHAIDSETEPTGNEGRSRVMKNEGYEVLGNGSLPRQPMYVNSNVQGVNNSILYNSSCSFNDPGVHYSYSTMPLNGQVIHHNKPIQKRKGN